ncbi:dienelactone hydrolase family protein [Leifsonia flava]|nr:dienelactone hydrolase family protein [Leifsonia flava]
MGDLISRDVGYSHDGCSMLGYLALPDTSDDAEPLPAILLVHDAFGLTGDMIATAERYAALGFAVLAADVWGDRTTPATEPEIGPLIGGMARDRERWMGRIAAAHEALIVLPEVDAASVVAIGYCFGGSSALEYLRIGGDIRGAVSIHGGLDLLAPDWSAWPATDVVTDETTSVHVLLCTGADDPMATAPMRTQLESSLSAAGVDWETDLYSDTKHAFTNPKSAFSPMPDVVAYNPRSSARAWASTTRFLAELFPEAQLA